MKTKLFISLLLLTFVSCKYRVTVLKNQQAVIDPKYYKFKPTPNPSDFKAVDTNCVYKLDHYIRYDVLYTQFAGFAYHYLKFNGDGTFLLIYWDTPILKKDFDTVTVEKNSTYRGRYIITRDIIKMEQFIQRGSYQNPNKLYDRVIKKGQFRGDTLILNEDVKDKRFYIKVPFK